MGVNRIIWVSINQQDPSDLAPYCEKLPTKRTQRGEFSQALFLYDGALGGAASEGRRGAFLDLHQVLIWMISVL